MAVLKKSGDEQIAYRGKLLEIVRVPMSDGTRSVYFERARRAPGVRLIIHDSDRKKVLLTKEHRYELDRDDYRLPGGKVVDSLEDFHKIIKKDSVTAAAEQKAREEALEEAGVVANKVTPYHVSVVGATVEWDLHYFVIDEFTISDTGQKLEHGENITLDWYEYEKARDMCLDGMISEERSALVLLRWLYELGH